jgi:hypothetical protein
MRLPASLVSYLPAGMIQVKNAMMVMMIIKTVYDEGI